MGFYTRDELERIGFKKIGLRVKVSKKASIYNPENISIGDHVRIDDFSVLSAGDGGIEIGNNVHIAVFCSLIGDGKIVLSDFSGLSSRVSIYSSSDDYTGNFLTNPTVPSKYKRVRSRDVIVGRHCIVGCGSVILPGAKLFEGVAIGALSLVTKKCEEWGVYSGNPLTKMRQRKKTVLELEKEYMASDK